MNRIHRLLDSMNIWDFRHIRERSVMRKVIRIRFYIWNVIYVRSIKWKNHLVYVNIVSKIGWNTFTNEKRHEKDDKGRMVSAIIFPSGTVQIQKQFSSERKGKLKYTWNGNGYHPESRLRIYCKERSTCSDPQWRKADADAGTPGIHSTTCNRDMLQGMHI